MLNGEYGWAENEIDYVGNVLSLKKIELDSFTCHLNKDGSYCLVGSIALGAGTDHSVSSSDSNGACGIDGDGKSYCVNF